MLISWFPALTTTGLLAAALWLGRNLISTRLTKSVEHEFNVKLKDLDAKLKESEARLNADLRAKESEIATLRSGAMTAMASRQIAVDKRRLEAIDQLWAAFNSLNPARYLSMALSTLKFEAVAKRAETDPKMRQFIETIGAGFDMKALDLTSATRARPFVSPVAWATYSAYTAVCMHAVMRWHVLRSGLGVNDFVDNDKIKGLITAALPYLAEYIVEHGSNCYHFVLESLETKLLQDIQEMLAGVESDKASIERAAEILKRSNEVLQQASMNQNTELKQPT